MLHNCTAPSISLVTRLVSAIYPGAHSAQHLFSPWIKLPETFCSRAGDGRNKQRGLISRSDEALAVLEPCKEEDCSHWPYIWVCVSLCVWGVWTSAHCGGVFYCRSRPYSSLCNLSYTLRDKETDKERMRKWMNDCEYVCEYVTWCLHISHEIRTLVSWVKSCDWVYIGDTWKSGASQTDTNGCFVRQNQTPMATDQSAVSDALEMRTGWLFSLSREIPTLTWWSTCLSFQFIRYCELQLI